MLSIIIPFLLVVWVISFILVDKLFLESSFNRNTMEGDLLFFLAGVFGPFALLVVLLVNSFKWAKQFKNKC